MTVALLLIDEPAARAILAGDWPPGLRCADDFPAAGDQIASRMFLERLDAGLDPRPFGIFLVLDDHVVIGGVGFHGEPDHRGQVEIGYGIVASQRGQGHATRALELLMERARELGAVSLLARVDPGNVASRKVLTHCSFQSSALNPDTFERALTC